MKNLELIRETISKIEPLEEQWFISSKIRLDSLTKPLGSLGRLEDLAQKICAIRRTNQPVLASKVIFTLAADHGVTTEGVSAYPSEVTPQMVFNFLRGGAGINVLARMVNARVIVVDMGIAMDMPPTEGLVNLKVRKGTSNFASGPAMSREEASRAIAAGIQLVENELKNGLDIVGTGDTAWTSSMSQ
jgi:nicotinate-nucleotide--dimethylbenzimidazole phosphoribosyltransferase